MELSNSEITDDITLSSNDAIKRCCIDGDIIIESNSRNVIVADCRIEGDIIVRTGFDYITIINNICRNITHPGENGRIFITNNVGGVVKKKNGLERAIKRMGNTC